MKIRTPSSASNRTDSEAPSLWIKLRVLEWSILLAGLITTQGLLYGPCLIGKKILLPLDVLAKPGVYLPRTPDVEKIEPRNQALSDLIYLFEPARRFAISELNDGRWPAWAPYEFCGAPFIWPKFSPFSLLQCTTISPVILAWTQLLAALVAGLGAFAFFRQALDLSFWPATIGAWCYPITGFLTLWLGFPTIAAVYWLPWILLAVNKLIRDSSPWWPVGLSIATCLALISGHLDIAGQVLLVAGLYAAWLLWQTFRSHGFRGRASQCLVKLALSFGTGILLACPYILPVLEYSRESSRMALRISGKEERRTVGLPALPQVVLPDMYGSLTQNCGFRISQGTELETSAGAYAGVIPALLLVPLAWSNRRRFHDNVFWGMLALVGLSWCLNVPGFVQLMRLPGLNMMSHNRLVFASSFAILTMGVIGLETLREAEIRWRKAFWVPVFVLGTLCVWSLYQAVILPESVTTDLEQLIAGGGQVGWTHDLAGVRRIQVWFVDHYAMAALLCGSGVIGWLVLRRGWITQKRFLGLAGAVMVADLLWYSHGRAPQCDPALYCPPIPVLEEIARAAGHGRVIGYDCLPANIASLAGLRDIRGYDGIDPRKIVELVKIAVDDTSPGYDYAATQSISPTKIALTRAGDAQLSPLLNMLGVRYVIFRKNPPKWPAPVFQGVDYWALENREALPRAFVPRRVEVIRDDKHRLAKLRSKTFDPREVAYVEEPVNLGTACMGVAQFRGEVPSRVSLALEMETPGLVVLADQWDRGWRAFVDGKRLPILRVNHALRGVVVPVGTHILEFHYQPESFVRGLWLSGLGGTALTGWLLYSILKRIR